MRAHKAGEDGTIEPICSGFASQRRKNMPALEILLAVLPW
jgi:hypothetical protein